MDQPITRAEHISIHALSEEGDLKMPHQQVGGGISIHALSEEGDGGFAFAAINDKISIHALSEEGDKKPKTPC